MRIEIKPGTESHQALTDIFKSVARREIKMPKTVGEIRKLLELWQKEQGK